MKRSNIKECGVKTKNLSLRLVFPKDDDERLIILNKLRKEGATREAIAIEQERLLKEYGNIFNVKIFIGDKEWKSKYTDVGYLQRAIEHRLDYICVVCGSIPDVNKKVEESMASPWHCKNCSCPSCGRQSNKIKARNSNGKHWLECPCGWTLEVGT